MGTISYFVFRGLFRGAFVQLFIFLSWKEWSVLVALITFALIAFF